jgi:hypothetical protein
VSDGLVKIVRRWTWKGKAPLEKATLSVRYRVEGVPAALKPFLPGILLYGNPSNRERKDGRVPVFAGEDGRGALGLFIRPSGIPDALGQNNRRIEP